MTYCSKCIALVLGHDKAEIFTGRYYIRHQFQPMTQGTLNMCHDSGYLKYVYRNRILFIARLCRQSDPKAMHRPSI
ncbi:mCG147683 [Mus musculus]|nr:mCG147683 [Mus musculus]